MSILSAEPLLAVAALILVAVAAGTLSARLFVAAAARRVDHQTQTTSDET